MELLFLIDRTLTRLIQTCSKYFLDRLHLSLFFQGLLGFIIASITLEIVSFSDLIGIAGEASPFRFYFLIYCLFIPAGILLGHLCGFILAILYRFFDEESFSEPNKEYLDGHIAWGFIISGVVCILSATTFKTYSIAPYIFNLGILAFIPEAYTYFANRKRGSGKKTKAPVTERLKKLIEACKEWLPQPKPAPAPQSQTYR